MSNDGLGCGEDKGFRVTVSMLGRDVATENNDRQHVGHVSQLDTRTALPATISHPKHIPNHQHTAQRSCLTHGIFTTPMDSVRPPLAAGMPSARAISTCQPSLQLQAKSSPGHRLVWSPIGKRTDREQSARSKASRRKPHAGVDFPRWALRGFLDLSSGLGRGRCGKGGVVRVK